MKNITRQFQEMYVAKKALIILESVIEKDFYVEVYDMDETWRPINARPLNEDESHEMALTLLTRSEDQHPFLHCAGLLPDNVLHLDTSKRGGAIWYTPPQKRQLFFKSELSIDSGKAWIPPLLWKADKEDLYIFALQQTTKPSLKTPIFIAPFFNVYDDGRVCMGNVDVEISDHLSLERFMQTWEQYFFNSFFSHVLDGLSPLEGNIIQIWQEQIATPKKFPLHLLKKQGITLKKLIA